MSIESSIQFSAVDAARAVGTLKLIEVCEIRADLLADSSRIIKSALNACPVQVHPRLVHLCGIPGAGKTTYARKWMQENPNFALVQFDSIMDALPGYRADVETLGLVAAFANWELPARIIGYHLLQALVDGKRNVLFDHSAAALTHASLLENAKASGYLVEMHHLQCDPAEALTRIKKREFIDKRHTPPELVHERLNLLKDLVPRYVAIVDKFVSV